MNVFGGARFAGKGPRGPRGFRGRDSSIVEFCTWLPQTVLKNLQANDETCCFFIQDPAKDLKRNGKEILEWISRSLPGLNLVAEKSTKEIELLEDRYVMTFKKTRYSSEDLSLLPNIPNTYGFLCITFRASTVDQVLLSDYQKEIASTGYCEIKLLATGEIFIHVHTAVAVIQPPISYNNWTTLFIECSSGETTTHYSYRIKEHSGSFVGPTTTEGRGGFSLGSRWDDTLFFNGQIASLEMYSIENSASFPEGIKKTVIKNQSIKL